MGSVVVVRASDYRPEGLGSMPDATKYLPSTHDYTRAFGDGPRNFEPWSGSPNRTHYNSIWAMGSVVVVRASDYRPEGLGSMPDATKYLPSTHGVRAR
ncbi:hypothetical protein TNCV_3463961 [Trichonephila clavipes]|nr:hypothetical protein TNCV_3463961 [Trichonephila clavipes]